MPVEFVQRMEIYEICKDCKCARFYSEDPGFSPRECGLPSRRITYLDGCKKNLEPYYDEEEEAYTCEGYQMEV